MPPEKIRVRGRGRPGDEARPEPPTVLILQYVSCTDFRGKLCTKVLKFGLLDESVNGAKSTENHVLI